MTIDCGKSIIWIFIHDKWNRTIHTHTHMYIYIYMNWWCYAIMDIICRNLLSFSNVFVGLPHWSSKERCVFINDGTQLTSVGKECHCGDWHGCIMSQTIVGLDGVQPYKFSECSLSDYHVTLQRGHAICLLNRPGNQVASLALYANYFNCKTNFTGLDFVWETNLYP